MYGPGRMGYVGRGWRPGPRGGYGPPFPVAGFAVGVVIFVLAAASLDFFPFFFFWWIIPFFLVTAIVLSVRSLAGLVEGRSGGSLDEDH